MKDLIKTVSFIAVMSVIPGAFAATSRASIMGQTTSRLPSIAGYLNPVLAVAAAGSSGSSGSTTDASSLLTNSECIDSYTSCIKGADACGANFEECTTNVLFHAQMPKCLSVLAQCSSSGINDLFGATSVSALADIAEQNTHGEVTRYTYPTDGSVLGQMITGAAISNKYDTQQCVKRYTSCLKKDSVCGNDFELCTTPTEFKKQYVFCASTLARCQSDAIKELFGSTNTSVPPTADSRLGMMIADGADLAAVNAVSTCYKVADQCILNACGANPSKCMVNASAALVAVTDAINAGARVTPDQLADLAGTISKSDVNKYIRNMCQETIGGNKYCYATVNEGKMPKGSELIDEDNREMVFEDVYASRMNSAMSQKLQSLLDKFDEKTKDKCVETIKSCAMRSCGGGVGSVCYSLVFGGSNSFGIVSKGASKSINGENTYEDIRLGCEAIVNTEASCQYAVASTSNNAYLYSYTDNNAFTTLFPEYDGTNKDPIGVIAMLNASLSTSYNEAAIASMKKQCATTAVSCVKSLCGKDYINCYRNRNDVMSTTYDSGSEAFDRSMNKMGGVLDYTVVTGLCLNTVKNSKVCDEHLKIEGYKLRKNRFKLGGSSESSWGSSDVRSDWLGAAGSVSVTEKTTDITIGCRTETPNCDESAVETCGTVDDAGCLYDQEVTRAWTDYVVDQSATTLFQEVLMDLEKEAQAKYKARLTKEQNVCYNNNAGGIKGANDLGSTFMWVKLKNGKIPGDYSIKGLTDKQITASNDVYGSFCRARITVKTDDKKLQEKLGDKLTAYFAVGDSFTCGSWIDQKTLDEITDEVRKQAGKGEGVNSTKGKMTMIWSALGGAAVGGVGGGLLGEYLQHGKIGGGGLMNSDAKQKVNKETNAGSCVSNAEKCKDKIGHTWTDWNAAKGYCKSAISDARAAKVNSSDNGKKEYDAAKEAFDAVKNLTRADFEESLSTDNKKKLDNLDAAMGNLLDLCQTTHTENNKKEGHKGAAIGATIGALAVGGLGAGIAATALEAKKRSVQDKAVKEWLETVGEHIQCYLGDSALGSYGDVITFNFDELQN